MANEKKGSDRKLSKITEWFESKECLTLDDFPGAGKKLEFKPFLSPPKMLALGVFEGKYINNLYKKLPKELFAGAIKRGKIIPDSGPDPGVNLFGIKSRMSLSEWKKRGWIGTDKKGWFQWYINYWLGRRLPEEDLKQIKRWNAIARHRGQIDKNCKHKKDIKGRCSDIMNCRPKQRQALLQWAWNFT
jgi:hypothetical protein